MDIKLQVIESKGFMYHINNYEEFIHYLKDCENDHVKKINKEIEDAIQ